MESPNIVPPKTHEFKSNCRKCQKNLKKLLSRQDGVYNIKVEEIGRETEKSSGNPNKSNGTIGEATKERKTSYEGQTPNEKENDVRVCQCQIQGFEGADLQELAKTNKLKQLKFTQNLEMIFNKKKDVNGASQKGYDNEGTPLEPKKDNDQNHFVGTNASQHESWEATHSSNLGGGDVDTPIQGNGGPYHHPPPANHGYNYCSHTPHHNHSAGSWPPKVNDVDKSRDSVSNDCSIS